MLQPRGFHRVLGNRKTTALPAACAAILLSMYLVPSAGASIACPALLFDGVSGPESLTLSFMDHAKQPIQQLAFSCATLRNGAVHHVACHSESGIFFPGTTYAARIDWPEGSGHLTSIALTAVRLADGYLWSPRRDQPCRPLQLSATRKR